MVDLKSKMLDCLTKGKGIPIGYHTNSFGENQIVLTIQLFYGLKSDPEKEEYEKEILHYLNSTDHNLRWVAYVVCEFFKFTSTQKAIDKLVENKILNERDLYVCPKIVDDLKRKFKGDDLTRHRSS